MGSAYTQLLLHAVIRWLSRGKVLARLFPLRPEVLLVVIKHNSDFASLLVDVAGLLALCRISDIFSKLNELNLSLQGKSSTVLHAYDKIKAFEKKLVLWISYLKDRQFAPLPTLESFLAENDVFVDSEFLEGIRNHLKIVKQKFETYFPNNFRYRRKNSYLSFQVTGGLKCNSVILVCLDSGSHLQ
jgi:hypothetical protein